MLVFKVAKFALHHPLLTHEAKRLCIRDSIKSYDPKRRHPL